MSHDMGTHGSGSMTAKRQRALMHAVWLRAQVHPWLPPSQCGHHVASAALSHRYSRTCRKNEVLALPRYVVGEWLPSASAGTLITLNQTHATPPRAAEPLVSLASAAMISGIVACKSRMRAAW